MLRFFTASLAFLFFYSFLLLKAQTLQLTSSSFNEQYPCVGGNNIAWTVDSKRITVFNTVSKTFISLEGSSLFSVSPVIGGKHLIWLSGNVMHYDLAAYFTTQVTETSSPIESPDVYGRQAVWHGIADGNFEIFLCHLEEGFNVSRLTNNSADDRYPQMRGNLLVWQRNQNGKNQIVLRRFHTGQSETISDSLADHIFPQTDGTSVVWQGFDGSDFEIYLYDTLTFQRKRLTNNTFKDQSPQVSGDWAVWSGDTNGVSQIFLYHISTGETKQLTADPYPAEQPRIDGRYITWAANGQIYLYNVESEQRQQISLAGSTENGNSQIDGQNVVWDGKNGGLVSIFWHKIPLFTDSDETENRPVFQAFPNPVSDGRLQVFTEKPARVQLINEQGVEVLNTKTESGILELTHLPSGIYRLNWQTDNQFGGQLIILGR